MLKIIVNTLATGLLFSCSLAMAEGNVSSPLINITLQITSEKELTKKVRNDKAFYKSIVRSSSMNYRLTKTSRTFKHDIKNYELLFQKTLPAHFPAIKL